MKEVERTYYCDLTGKQIDDLWAMLRIELDYGDWQITPRGMDSTDMIHIHPDEHDIKRGNDEPGEWNLTAYVTQDSTIAMFEFDAHGRQYIDPSGNDTFGDLADRIETEVIDDESPEQ